MEVAVGEEGVNPLFAFPFVFSFSRFSAVKNHRKSNKREWDIGKLKEKERRKAKSKFSNRELSFGLDGG